MNYFTKEELDYIANSLLNNPSRGTLEELNNKYNLKVIEEPVQNQINTNTNIPSFEIPSFNPIDKEPLPTVEPPKVDFETFTIPNENTINNGFTVNEPITIPNLSSSAVQNSLNSETIMNNSNNSIGISALENNQNNNMLNINSNLWEQPNPNNLMTTTDNFNINNTPFFGTQTEPVVNNPIPVGGQYTSGPSMFGQIMKDNS